MTKSKAPERQKSKSSKARNSLNNLSLLRARIVANYGHQYLAMLAEQRTDQQHPFIRLVSRGKKVGFAVGDIVDIRLQGMIDGIEQGVIEHLIERQNIFYRSEFNKQKNLAANIDQVGIVVASEPSVSEELLGRAVICAEVSEIDVLIIANKSDLNNEYHQALLDRYEHLGYPVVDICAHQPETFEDKLYPMFDKRTTLLMGQSGVGKSSLINSIIPTANIRTQEISNVLNSGKHTTTFARLYDCSFEHHTFSLIDSPGFEQFGMAQFTLSQIQHAMPELRNLMGQCRFNNCNHIHEPGCAVLEHLESDLITIQRYDLYVRLVEQLAFYERSSF